MRDVVRRGVVRRMAKENGYWIYTEHGYVYVYQPEIGEVQEFRRRWMRHALRIFLVLAVLWTLYFFGPFPHFEVGGFVLHP
jgi:hypothetical protein